MDAELKKTKGAIHISLVPESGWLHPIPSLLSCPRSDHDWRGDSATGYQQSC